jgi:hypothetical protein
VKFLEFCRYLRILYPPQVRIVIDCDNFSSRLTTLPSQPMRGRMSAGRAAGTRPR